MSTTSITTLTAVLAFLGWILQIGILLSLYRGDAFKNYKAFVYYTLFVALTTPIGFFFNYSKHPLAGFYYYYTQDAISIVLALIVQREIVQKIFEHYEGIRGFGMKLFYAAIVGLILVGFGASFSFQEHNVHADAKIIFPMELAVRFIQVGLVLFLMFFMRTLALVWKREYFAIALGFGQYATASIIAYGLKIHFGVKLPQSYLIVIPVFYFVAQSIWAAAILFPVRVPAAGELPDFSHLEKWNKMLTRV